MKDDFRVFVVENKERILGFIVFRIENKYGILDNIVVAKESQKKVLIEHVLSTLKIWQNLITVN